MRASVRLQCMSDEFNPAMTKRFQLLPLQPFIFSIPPLIVEPCRVGHSKDDSLNKVVCLLVAIVDARRVGSVFWFNRVMLTRIARPCFNQPLHLLTSTACHPPLSVAHENRRSTIKSWALHTVNLPVVISSGILPKSVHHS